MKHSIIVSFVHGYSNLDINLPDTERPALWIVKSDSIRYLKYLFPRNPDDFFAMKNHIVGEMPFSNANNFKKLPRFGFTGLAQTKEYIFAGSWNSVYKIRKKDYIQEKIITNHLMNDMHGIYVNEDIIITILTCKDTIVFSDHQGNILDYFLVNNDLNVVKDESINETDWRFASKQFRGSTGYWHFNYVQKFGNELWLTSRNANAFIVINLDSYKAHLRLMNLSTPALLHDGVRVGNKYYFTSIDGKIIIAESYKTAEMQHNREDPGNMYLYNRDLVTKVIRLNEAELEREPNWCRGIACYKNILYVTIDGRYDTDLSFGLISLREEDQKILSNYRLEWSEVGNEEDIRFVTGFDVMLVE